MGDIVVTVKYFDFIRQKISNFRAQSLKLDWAFLLFSV
jgi:hypothetical protein